jgi:hypothetical protein
MSRFNMQAVPAYIYVAVLVIAGFALVYIFEPTNKRNAFYAGAGVLGFLATFSPIAQQTLQIPTPSELPSLDSIIQATQASPDGIQPAAPDTTAPAGSTAPATPPGHAMNETPGAPVSPAIYQPLEAGAPVILADAQVIPVIVIVRFSATQGTSLPPMHVWLHDNIADRTQTLNNGTLARAPSGVVAVYQTRVISAASGDKLADLSVRVEAEGYQITVKEVNAAQGSRPPIRIDVDLQPSNSPLAIQRLTFPYRW